MDIIERITDKIFWSDCAATHTDLRSCCLHMEYCSFSHVVSHICFTDEVEDPVRTGPEVIKLFSCSTQLSMKFSLRINLKMPTIVGSFIFISRGKFHALLCLARKNLQLLLIWYLFAGQISCSAELNTKKVYNLGARIYICNWNCIRIKDEVSCE